ncbi:MAG: alpha/beta hydrolase [Desulfobacteraceae bacterium]|nr:alpha/beta hydrolase [Desulfobacteraceae bacterium]
MDGTGELFRPLIDSLGDIFEIETISYPLEESLRYEELLNLVSNRIPKQKQYFLLGESFSGPLAVMAASKSSENLLGIILVATFVKSPMPQWMNRLKWFLRGPMLDMRPRPFIIERLLGKDCPEKTKRWVQDTLPRLKREVLAARIKAVMEVNVREELKSCQVPVLYIAGSRDWLVGKKCLDVIWLCRPDVEIKVIDGAHMILQARPAEAAAAIIEFCNRYWSSESSVQSSEEEQD